MKKRSIFTTICAFVCALSVLAGVGCVNQDGGSQAGTSTDDTQSSSSIGGSENDDSTPNNSTPEDSTPEDSTPDTSTPDDSTPDDTPPEEAVIAVTAPVGEVYPYVDEVKTYLQAGAGADVADYWVAMENAYAPIQVQWTYDAAAASKFLVEYATKDDFSDALSVTASTTKRSADLYNLYRGTTYYVRVSALNSKGETLYVSETSEFQTTSLGPRVMKVDDIHNVRDLGGYETLFGKTILQGIAYRGGSLTPPPKDTHYDSNLSAEGKQYMSETLGIKAELDFRNEEESGVLLADGSVIPGAQLTYLGVVAYESAISGGQERYRKVFSYLADENNYPLYYHCTGGADRTGTVTFLLHALLGVSELECIQGYEMTSFSTYGVRSSQSGRWGEEFQPFLTGLKAFPGNTLQEKTENYMLSIGVTEDEIYNIKAIFFGEPTKTTISAPTSYIKNVDDDFIVTIAGKKVPTKLYLGNQEVPFSYNAGKITVTADQLPALPNGMVDGRVVFVDGTETPFSLEWKVLNVTKMDGLFTFGESGVITLTANKTPLKSDGVIGYQTMAMIRAETTTVDKTDGGYRVFIGSYGFECRGGEVRPYTLDANGTMKEVLRDAGMGLSNTSLNTGATLYLSVEFVDNKPVMTVRLEKGATVVEYTYTFASRVANEIASDNAKMTFWIRTDAVTSLTLYNSSAWANR